MKVRRLSVVASGLLLLADAGPLRAGTPDTGLNTKARIALLTTNGVNGTAIEVDTVGGRLTLLGKVGSEGEKQRAAAAVARIEGVKGVRNLLQVVPDLGRPTLKVADDAIRTNVEAALKADFALKGVGVASVTNGVVVLRGKTADLARKLRAIEVAWAVQGVQGVSSDIEAGPARATAPPAE